MTSQTEKQIILLHRLPSISRNKGNQTMKFGQLIEYNMKYNYTICFYCMSQSRAIEIY